MRRDGFVGHLKAKSFFNNVDLGKDYDSERIEFTVDQFLAYAPVGNVVIVYGVPISEGLNTIRVGTGHNGLMTYLGYHCDGEVRLTVDPTFAHHTATFTVYYYDGIGRLLKLEGEFDGTYDLL
ncbi:UNVERIFIED_ORG: hypothetical protein J2X80_002813 [Pseudomonas fluorescens]|uniref:hypothetical protein n=1 Tax=unclassified Pseudomonas TaxID=196821 RepID=UPI000A1E74B9|nr:MULTISPECIES: hypothetical protein [unclassified Pseudomonas]MDP9710730.1 hypothetical protein [Pseudomonas fluorescens]